MHGNERGFVMVAVMFMLSLTMIGATLMFTTDVTVHRRSRVEAAHLSLVRIDSAMVAFRADSVLMYPQSLTHLQRPIANSDLNSCGNRYNDNSNRWRGPYFARVIEGDGLRIGIGRVQAGLSRTNNSQGSKSGGSGGGQTSDVFLQVTDVREQDLMLLDNLVDGAIDRVSGRLQWVQPDQTGFTTARYFTITGTKDC